MTHREARHQIARNKAIEWARQISEQPRVAYLDTESTGFDENAEICDIAVVDSTGRVLLDTLVKPQNPIPEGASRVHGITDETVADAPSWVSVYYQLLRILEDYSPIVIYNVKYDTRIMNQVNKRFGLPEFKCDWQDAMERYAEFHGEWKQQYGSYTWQKLTNAGKQMSVSVDDAAHRALADAQLTRLLVGAMATAEVEEPQFTIDEKLQRAFGDAGMRGGNAIESAYLQVSIRMLHGFELFGNYESWGAGFEVCDGDTWVVSKSLDRAVELLTNPKSQPKRVNRNFAEYRRPANLGDLQRHSFYEKAADVEAQVTAIDRSLHGLGGES